MMPILTCITISNGFCNNCKVKTNKLLNPIRRILVASTGGAEEDDR